MGNVGRFFCVALPFILTAGSIICMLIVGLVGVTNNPNLYMFRVNTTDLQINRATIQNLLKATGVSLRDVSHYDRSLLETAADTTRASAASAASAAASAASAAGSAPGAAASAAATAALTNNITAADLSLASLYDVNLWGYCSTSQDGNRTCTKAKFDWAETYLNTSNITGIGAAAGMNITLPTEVTNSLKAFKTVAKWTEVVFIIAMVALGIELFGGIFTYCSRAVSCITYLISGIATAAVIAAAIMITVMSSLVIGAVQSTAKWYGVSGSINTSYLATVWLGVAFALGASFFWLFSACCCKRDHYSKPRRNKLDDEKPFLPTRSYAPLHDEENHGPSYGQPAYGAPRHNNARTNLAYEPYTHSRV